MTDGTESQTPSFHRKGFRFDLFRLFTWVASAATVATLVCIAASILVQAWPAIAHFGLGFFTTVAWKTSDPETALGNLLVRDEMFTSVIREETKRLELPAIEVDAGMTEDDLARQVSRVLAF